MIDASELTNEEREKLTRLIESGYENLEKTNCRRCDEPECEYRATPQRLQKGILGGQGLCPRLSGKVGDNP